MPKPDELLEKIHKNANTGLYALPKVKQQVTDRHFRAELAIQETEYRNLFASAEGINHRADNEIGAFAKMRSAVMIKACGNDTSKQAQMLLLGSTMGIVDVTRALKKNPDAPKSTRALAENFLAVEERNVTVLKQYL